MRVCSNDPTHRDLGTVKCRSCGGQVIEVPDPKPADSLRVRAREHVAQCVAHALAAEAAATAADVAAKRAMQALDARANGAGDASEPMAAIQRQVQEARSAGEWARRHADDARVAQEEASAGAVSVAEAINAAAGDTAMQTVTQAAARAAKAAEQAKAALQNAVAAADGAENAIRQLTGKAGVSGEVPEGGGASDQVSRSSGGSEQISHSAGVAALLERIGGHKAAAVTASQTTAGLLSRVRAAVKRAEAAVLSVTQATGEGTPPHPGLAAIKSQADSILQAEADVVSADATARQHAEAVASAHDALARQPAEQGVLEQVHQKLDVSAKGVAEATAIAGKAVERAEAIAGQAESAAATVIREIAQFLPGSASKTDKVVQGIVPDTIGAITPLPWWKRRTVMVGAFVAMLMMAGVGGVVRHSIHATDETQTTKTDGTTPVRKDTNQSIKADQTQPDGKDTNPSTKTDQTQPAKTDGTSPVVPGRCSDKAILTGACRRTPEELRIEAEQRLRGGQVESASQLLQAAADQNDGRAEVLLAQIFDPTSEASLAPHTSANARMAAVYYRRAQGHGEDTEQALSRIRAWLDKQAQTGDEVARGAIRDVWKP